MPNFLIALNQLIVPGYDPLTFVSNIPIWEAMGLNDIYDRTYRDPITDEGVQPVKNKTMKAESGGPLASNVWFSGGYNLVIKS